MLHENIKGGIKSAMLKKDTVRLETLRFALSAFTNELLSKGKKPTEMLTDEEVLIVLAKLAKQRKDSILQYRNGGRDDLVAEEESQLAILEEFLPTLMSKEEIEKIAKAKKEDLGIDDPSKKGILMASLMKDLKGKADGMEVKGVVDSLF